MEKINIILQKSIEDILMYDPKNSIEIILKTVMEAILKAERGEFLLSSEENNKGNGYYERLVRGVNQYFKLNVPRDRLSLFKPVFLEAIKQYDAQMQDLALKLYVKGLTTRDIESVLGDVFGKKISPTSISNITKNFEQQRKEWLQRPLDSEYYFIFIDALFIPVRRDTVNKEAFYIVMALRTDLKREILGVYNIPNESAEGWREVLKDLQKRGLKKVLMFIADGLNMLSDVVLKEFPASLFQRCIVHKMRNILLNVRTIHKAQIASDLKEIFTIGDPSYTFEKAQEQLKFFLTKWGKIYPGLYQKFKDINNKTYFAYLNFPYQIHKMIYTTNWIERLNKTIRRTQSIRNAFPNPESALNLITACLIEQENNFYLKYPLTFFSGVQNELNFMLVDCPQTQNC